MPFQVHFTFSSHTFFHHKKKSKICVRKTKNYLFVDFTILSKSAMFGKSIKDWEKIDFILECRFTYLIFAFRVSFWCFVYDRTKGTSSSRDGTVFPGMERGKVSDRDSRRLSHWLIKWRFWYQMKTDKNLEYMYVSIIHQKIITEIKWVVTITLNTMNVYMK